MAQLTFSGPAGTSTKEVSDVECLEKLGFIPSRPIRIVGDFSQLKADINRYGYFYGQLVILTDKEHTKICRRLKQWGGTEFKQLNREQFLREYETPNS